MAKEIESKEEKKELKTAVVNINCVNVRKEPSTDAEVVRIALKGEKVKVEEKLGEWTKIKGGFVMTQFIDA